MKKQRGIKGVLCVVLIIVAGLAVVFFSNRTTATSYGKIYPVLLEERDYNADNTKEISFRDKTIIAPSKYGFRRSITIEEPVIINQYSANSHFVKDYYYGIYKDKKLSDPIKEVDMNYTTDTWAKIEEGADEKDFPNYSNGFNLVLQPGTYYLGIYTTDFWSFERVDFVTEMVPYVEETELSEGQYCNWSWVDNKHSQILCKFIYPKSSEVQVSIENAPREMIVELLDSNKKSTGKVTKIKDTDYNCDETLTFKGEAGKTVYIKISCPGKPIHSNGQIEICKVKYE